MIRLAVAGAAGRMGSLCCSALETVPDIEVVARLSRNVAPGGLLSDSGADVLLDFTVAEASRGLAEAALGAGISPVIGTSGWSPGAVSWLQAACQQASLGALLVPNFSVGAVLQMRFARQAAAQLDCTSIREVHHTGKLDSPSGTASATADALEDVTGTRPSIHSERRDGCVAEQRVHFEGAGEALELVHRVADRQAYLPGILLAIRRVRGLSGLVVGLSALLD